MPKNYTVQYAANSAVRCLLQAVGESFDKDTCKKPALSSVSGSKEHVEALVKHFGWACCYCGEAFDGKDRKREREHLVPMNEAFGGMHSWRNVVFCCKPCNSERGTAEIEVFLKKKGYLHSLEKIRAWQKLFPEDFERTKEIQPIASELYREVSDLVKCYLEKTKTKLEKK